MQSSSFGTRCEIALMRMLQNLTIMRNGLVPSGNTALPDPMYPRHKDITWANIDPVLCRHMASLGHSELNCHHQTYINGYLPWWSVGLCRMMAHEASFHQLQSSFDHDDVIKWKHFPRYWPVLWGIHRSVVNSSHKYQEHGALMIYLIRVYTNDWVNNRDLRPGSLWRHSYLFRSSNILSIKSKNLTDSKVCDISVCKILLALKRPVVCPFARACWARFQRRWK